MQAQQNRHSPLPAIKGLWPSWRSGPVGEENHLLLSTHATPVRTRRRQQLSVAVDDTETVYFVVSGVLMVATRSDEDQRNRVYTILYEGDVYRSSFAPPFENTVLIALSPSELLRMPYHAYQALAERHTSLATDFEGRAASLQARTGLHLASLSSLPGDTRVATFLAELAFRTGKEIGNQVSFDVNLSRSDIANYLALNADTLSRIMSRLKTEGLVTSLGRGRIVITDFGALLARTPMADAVRALHAQA